jgi:hypothetical protein
MSDPLCSAIHCVTVWEMEKDDDNGFVSGPFNYKNTSIIFSPV